MAIIIEYDQATGLGDQYASIYSLYGVYQKLKHNTNSSIIVYCNSKISHYFGNNMPGLEFYSKIFDYSFLDQIYFNQSIPSCFVHKKYWHNNYFSFYSDNNIDDQLLNSIDFEYMGHTTLYNKDNSYNPLNIQPLINKDLLYNNIVDPFIVFHLRFHDSWNENTDPAEFYRVYKNIQSIIETRYSKHRIVIGGRNGMDPILKKVACKYIIKTEQHTDNIYNDVISYAKDMVLYSYADKIFAYCYWQSNFIKYSILHNQKQKTYKNLIEKI
jgi:hypothetical protein